jgi:flagellar hook-associated protein 3 FlgL
MRVTSMISNVQYQMQQSAQALATALQQVSTGKRVNQLSDDPSASSEMVRSLSVSATIDQYTSNATSLLPRLQQADSALSSVVTQLTQAVTLGTQGANSSVNTADRQALAVQVQGILDSVGSLANTKYQGAYLFAGTDSSAAPFIADAASSTGYDYNGNSGTNQVQIGDSLTVASGVAGDQLFTTGTDVLGSLNGLITALRNGTSTDIGNATAAVTSALTQLDQQRTPIGTAITQLDAQETYLSQETVTLSTQQNSLTGMSLAEAATNLSQAETDNSAALAAAARALPTSLLSYLK